MYPLESTSRPYPYPLSPIMSFTILKEVLTKEIKNVDYAIFCVTQDYNEHRRINIYKSLLQSVGYNEILSIDNTTLFPEKMKVFIYGKSNNKNDLPELQHILDNVEKYL